MQNLKQLNANGCGVCKKICWDMDVLSQKYEQQEKVWSKFVSKIKTFLRIKQESVELTPWCTLHSKFVKPLYKCLDYDPKKQLKIWGAREDEELKVDPRLIKGEPKWQY